MATTRLLDTGLGARNIAPGYFPIATRGSYPYPRATAAGQTIRGRIRHVLPYGCRNMILVYPGFKLAPSEFPMNVVTTTSATSTSGSRVLTSLSSPLQLGPVYGNFIRPGSTVIAVSIDGTSATMNQTSTGTGTAAVTQGGDIMGVHVGIEPTWDSQFAWNTAFTNGDDAIKKVVSKGQESMTIPADGLLFADLIGIRKAAGSSIGARIFVPVSNAVVSRICNIAQLTESGTVGSSTADNAWSGTMGVGGAGSASLGPITILGQAADGRRHPAVVLIGDSNCFGVISVSGGGTSFDVTDANGNCGWAERTLGVAVAFDNSSAPGDAFKYMFSDANSGYGRSRRLQAWGRFGYSHAVLALGTNDDTLYTVGQLQTLWITMLNELRGLGMKVIAVTPLPHGAAGSGNAVTRDFAAWIRANAISYGADSVADLNAAFADPIDNTTWNLGLSSVLGVPPTYDNIHMSQEAVVYAAGLGLINPGALTL